jgi:amino acid adenylation domain-containing protein
MQEIHEAGVGDVVLQKTPFSFDVSVWEFFWPLTTGARLEMARPGGHRDPGYLKEVIREVGVGNLHFVPSMLQAFLEHEGREDCTSIERVVCSGEALPAGLVRRFHERLPGVKLHNLYGPTEASVEVTAWECVEGDTRESIPIGRPIANTHIYILDSHGQPTPIGVAGELHIGGVQVARGYLNRPELTAERFVEDPFSGVAGARMYRTGDVARWTDEGVVEYLGRNDHQVKIRGFRIELGEIEAHIARAAGVGDVVVVASENDDGDKQLVAYYTGSTPPSVDQLREHARRVLPEYMVPAAYVRLEALPLTPNGKLDRRALPAPESDAYTSRRYEAPHGERERDLADLWRELLNVERVGRNDNFFELGGHSLLAVTLIERMRRLGLHADVRAVFATSTLKELAETVGIGGDEVIVPDNLIPPDATAITPEMLSLLELDQTAIDSIVAKVPGGAANVQDIYPLAPLQEGILFHHLMAPEGDVYLLRNILAFPTRELLDLFVRRLQVLVDRHDILRTGVLWEGLDEAVQVVQRQATLDVRIVELSERKGDAAEQLKSLFSPRHYRMDIRTAPLMRGAAGYDSVGNRWLLTIVAHHLCIDHVTLEKLVEETELTSQELGTLHREPVPFRRFVAQARLGARREEQEAFFHCLLKDIDEPTAPFGILEVHGTATAIAEARRFVSPQLSSKLRECAGRSSVSVASLVHLAWGLVLARTAGRPEVVFGTVMFGRLQGLADADRALGLFINTVPVRLSVGELGIGQSLQATHKLLAQLIRHENAPLALAQRCSGVPAGTPLFGSLLNYRHSEDTRDVEPNPSRAEVIWGEERTNYPLTLSVDDLGRDFLLTAQASAPIAPEQVCRLMETALENLVAALEQRPSTPTCRVEVLPLTERDQVLARWNATARDFPRGRCLHELFEAQVVRTPNAVAVVSKGREITYADLNARANRLARALQELEVGPDDRVGICVERGLEMVVGMLGILKAGGAYVPLDATYPTERLRYMLEDCAPKAVLTDAVTSSAVAALARGICTIALDGEELVRGRKVEGENVRCQGLTSRHLAYVIYTSGSTGTPKGVAIPHDAIANHMLWMQAEFGFTAADVVLQRTPVSFDASVWEFYAPLLVGARMVMAPESLAGDPQPLLETLVSEEVTVVQMVPSLLRILLEHGELGRCTTLRYLFCGGEALETEYLRALPSTVNPAVVNLYGPTETTIDATFHRWQSHETDQWVSIGRPVANTRAYVLDRWGEVVPTGVVGELYIGGVQVARGYLNKPEQSAERFVEDCFSAEAGARMYRTGDLARWLPDGRLEFLGRNDGQVKLLGHRIELREVEARLGTAAGVMEVVVVVREDVPGDRRLVAYYTGADAPGIDRLREHARGSLPAYMVPTAYVCLDRLPLMPNGKLDRKALPQPESGASRAGGYEVPQGAIEETLAAMWQDLLKLDRVSRTDNFFEMGGHSLLAVSLIERMRRAGLQADVRALFATPTLAGLAGTLNSKHEEIAVPENLIPPNATFLTPEMLPLVTLDQAAIDRTVAKVPGGAGNVQDIYPLAPLQEGILFHHLLAEDRDTYLVPSLLEFTARSERDTFIGALERVIARHDILRTAIIWEDLDEPVQVVQRQVALPVETAALSSTGGPAADQLRRRYDPRRFRIDLSKSPLIRLIDAYDSASERWLLMILAHHIVLDHASLEMLIEETNLIIEGRAEALPSPVPFRTFVARARLGVRREEHEAFFRRLLGDVSEPTAPFGLLEVREDRVAVTESRKVLDPMLAAAIRMQSRKYGVSAASVMHLAWALVIAEVSRRSDVVFGTVMFGRMQGIAESERALGMFMNTVPFRLGVHDRSVEQGLKEAHSLLGQLIRHEHAPLALAQKCSGVAANTPLFSALLNYRHSRDVFGRMRQSAPAGGAEGESRGTHDHSNYPLCLDVDDLGRDFMLTAQVRGAIDPSRVCAFVETALTNLIDALALDASQPLAFVDVLPPAEQHAVLRGWNETEREYPRNVCIHEVFEATAAASPDAVAVVDGEGQCSYRLLNEEANRLANCLQGLGVGPDRLVGLCLERGRDMVIGLLAVLKAGGAYVPLDPAYPSERLAAMVAECAPAAILGHQSTLQKVSSSTAGIPLIDLKRDRAQWSERDTANLPVGASGVSPRNLAYVIYTSGSTGRPKGVMIEHRSLVNYTLDTVRWFALTGDDRVLQQNSLNFDLSIDETLPTLIAGATLVPANALFGSEEERYPTSPTCLHLTTAHWHTLVAEWTQSPSQALSRLAGVRLINVAGEAMSTQKLQQWEALQVPGTRVINTYGPAETTVTCSAAYVSHEPGAVSVTIGRPFANTKIYVLNSSLRPAPIGIPGELYVAGVQVGRGYLNRPDLTEERFVADPFSADPDARMYRTGDLGRWLPNGTLECLGRDDFQVKVRGFRIELGEIEARLAALDGIAEVAVMAREDEPGDKRLVAYYTGDSAPAVEAIRDFARRGLPDYMVPVAYVHLEALPLSPNGKLDRRSLPMPGALAYSAPSFEAPEGEAELALAAIWGELLGVRDVGRNANFFEMGGHSLIAVQVVSRLRRSLDVDVSLSDLFAHPVLRDLAMNVSSAAKAKAKPIPVLTRRRVE